MTRKFFKVIIGASFFVGLCFILYFIKQLLDFSFGLQEVGIMTLLELILTLLSVVSFFTVSQRGRQRNSKLQFSDIMALMPSAWACVNLGNQFIYNKLTINITEVKLQIAFTAALTMFLLFYAKFTSGFFDKRVSISFIVYGVSTVILGVLGMLPNYINLFEENSTAFDFIGSVYFVGFILTLYAFLVMLYYMVRKLKKGE